jgi:hypothetical protein
MENIAIIRVRPESLRLSALNGKMQSVLPEKSVEG